MSIGRYDAKKRWEEKNPEMHELQKQKQKWEENKEKHNKSKRDLFIARTTFEIDESLAKPWNDPESLFCDVNFLTKPVKNGGLGLKIRDGDECKTQ